MATAKAAPTPVVIVRAQVATRSGAAYQDTGLSPATLYKYTIAAFDAAGNTSMQSAPASATTLATAALSPLREGPAVAGQIEASIGGAPATGGRVLCIWAHHEYFTFTSLRLAVG